MGGRIWVTLAEAGGGAPPVAEARIRTADAPVLGHGAWAVGRACTWCVSRRALAPPIPIDRLPPAWV